MFYIVTEIYSIYVVEIAILIEKDTYMFYLNKFYFHKTRGDFNVIYVSEYCLLNIIICEINSSIVIRLLH